MLVISNEEHKALQNFNKEKLPVIGLNLVWPVNSDKRYHAECYLRNGGRIKMGSDIKFDKYAKKKYHEQEVILVYKTSKEFKLSKIRVDKKDPENLFEKLK